MHTPNHHAHAPTPLLYISRRHSLAHISTSNPTPPHTMPVMPKCVYLILSYTPSVTGLVAYCCPCYQFGKNSEAVGDSCCLCCLCYMCFPFFCRCINRGKIRTQRGIAVSCVFGCFSPVYVCVHVWQFCMYMNAYVSVCVCECIHTHVHTRMYS